MKNIKVGILHSLSGTMAMSEVPLVEAALMAIAEINEAGGILGRKIEPVIEDGASDPFKFETKALKLLQQEQVVTVFGCWTSTSRKTVKPLFEAENILLWYPVQYEGLEFSPNIFYTGSCLNQQIQPTVSWILENLGKRFYLIGSDYVFPRTANKLIKAQIKQQGGTIVGEVYPPFGSRDFFNIITNIKKIKPDLVFNTLNGDSNFYFYSMYQELGIKPQDIPIVAVSIAESEVQTIGNAAVDHYACWSYFQSLNTPENHKFVANFKAKYGIARVTSDPIEAAYTQVYLWRQAVEVAGAWKTDEVRQAAYSQTFLAPSGRVRIEANHHLWKNCRIGRVNPSGQFDILWSSQALIKPHPWLGVEELNFPEVDLVISMLAEVPRGIQHSCLLEQKKRDLEATMQQLHNEIAERKRVELALQAANQELHQIAITDSLTQIANRRWFNECLRQELNRQIQSQTSLSLILCDIDFFKRYNDTYGHQQGDLCLHEIAQTIQKAVRHAVDCVARYGGEEFAVILPNTNRHEALQVARRICQEVEQLKIPHSASDVCEFVTVSLGVTSQNLTKTTSPEALIQLADQALYQAKHQGRNRYCALFF